MPTKRSPRKGTMQFWPRKRAADIVARIRIWPASKDAKLMGFPAYKVGMTHAIVTENRPNSPSKGEEVSMPLTILECPPMRVVAIHGYRNGYNGLELAGQQWSTELPKELSRTVRLPKKASPALDPTKLVDVRVLVCTQPRFTGWKRKPEMIELALGGSSVADKLAFATPLLGKDVQVDSVFAEGQQVDTHAVTTGKGLQGPVKRHGVEIRSHKAQKTRRGPASLGPWHGARTYRVAHQGQMGFHLRTEHNKLVVRIGKSGDDVSPKGGFMQYGIVRNPYIAVKGSVSGPPRRLVTLTVPTRPNPGIPKQAPSIVYLSRSSKQ